MAQYRVVEKSYIDGRIVEAGEVVEVEFTDGGKPGKNLELVDDKQPAKGKPGRNTYENLV